MNPQSDHARFEHLGRLMRQLMAEGMERTLTFQRLWRERETIKNRQPIAGMPPKPEGGGE